MKVIGYAIFYKDADGNAEYLSVDDPDADILNETVLMLTDNGAQEIMHFPIVDVEIITVPGS